MPDPIRPIRPICPPPAVVFDIETLRSPTDVPGGWSNPEALGFGTGIMYHSYFDRYEFYGPKDGLRFASDLMFFAGNNSDDLLVGFNHIRFDFRVLFGNDYAVEPTRRPLISQSCDLLLLLVQSKFNCSSVEEAEKKYGIKKVHGGLGLDAVARATLGRGKSGKGEDAPGMIQRGEWARVFSYNLRDVQLTYQLFIFACERGFLYDGTHSRIPISIPQSSSSLPVLSSTLRSLTEGSAGEGAVKS